MASRLCSPKSGSDWGPTNFLHTTSTSSSRTLPSFANEVLTKLNADDMTSDSNYKFVRYMDLAMNPAGKSALDNFAVWLLTLLGYAPRTSMTRTSVDIPLNICGEQHYAKTKRTRSHTEAIATFQANDTRRYPRTRPSPTFYCHRGTVAQGHMPATTTVVRLEELQYRYCIAFVRLSYLDLKGNFLVFTTLKRL